MIGKYVHAEDDQITLEIKDKELIVPKSSRFHSEEDHDDLIGKLVKVEVDGKRKKRKKPSLCRSQSRPNGVYEEEKDGSRKSSPRLSASRSKHYNQTKQGKNLSENSRF
ncbi:hypothetical protein PO124_27865 [Bacillus licheniformis]|nr:hypothetical protein [Bacillus licheniformis]